MTAEEILKCWAVHGCYLDSSIAQPLMEESVIYLYNCDDCGFAFFNPRLEGTPQFYGALYTQLPVYYAIDSPENLRNTRYAVERGYRTVLDVGCGSGSALDNAKRAGLETYGIEPSPSAATAASAKGHKIFPVLLEQMDAAWNGKFDLISFNQVLEHVSDPVGLIRGCVRLLSPRGVIAITVPSATGMLGLCPWLEHNWPPHHLSRWKVKDFYRLANRTGLRVLKAGGQPLEGRDLKSILLEHRKRCLALNKPYYGLPPGLIRAGCFIYRLMALQHIFSSQGHSVYCFLEHQNSKNSKV